MTSNIIKDEDLNNFISYLTTLDVNEIYFDDDTLYDKIVFIYIIDKINIPNKNILNKTDNYFHLEYFSMFFIGEKNSSITFYLYVPVKNIRKFINDYNFIKCTDRLISLFNQEKIAIDQVKSSISYRENNFQKCISDINFHLEFA